MKRFLPRRNEVAPARHTRLDPTEPLASIDASSARASTRPVALIVASSSLVALAASLGACSPRAASTPTRPDPAPLASMSRRPEFATLEERIVSVPLTERALRISAPDDGVFRIEVLGLGAPALPSFAIERSAPSALRELSLEARDAGSEREEVVVRGDELELVVARASGRVVVRDRSGSVLFDGLVSEKLDFELSPATSVFGLGDKVKSFDRRGSTFEFWNLDAYGWGVQDDPLYKSFPVFVLQDDERSRLLYVDSPARARVDVGKTCADRLVYEFDRARDFDFYLFAEKDPKALLASWTRLSGRMPLPPRWALGYHQSRYGYKTEEEIRGVEKRLRQDRIPLDVIWLDIDFQQGNAPFTVNEATFPHFTQMIADLRARGTKTVVITDPHIQYRDTPNTGYEPFDSGLAGDHFVHSPRGPGPFLGQVWPGLSVFPEFTLERTRRWWGSLYEDFVARGVAGFWNDMNEPATFSESKTFTLDVEHRLEDGSRVIHSAVHNAYGTLNVRATYEGLQRLQPEKRPFVLTRAASPGAQRWSASWTGDNRATREHLAQTIPQLAQLGVSGYPFVGADVGGFVGCPDPELFAEWMELGAYQPFFRNHAAHDACAREPWVFGAAIEERARVAVERRYQLVPYLYTAFEETSRTGAPVVRPLWFDAPDDVRVRREARSFLLGGALLIAPRLDAPAARGAAPLEESVVLPRGAWFDTRTNRLWKDGEARIVRDETSSVRAFARAGSIVPSMAAPLHLSAPWSGALELDVWFGERCEGSLYWDDGETRAHERGEFRRVGFSCSVVEGALRLEATSVGSFAVPWKDVLVRFHGAPKTRRARVRGVTTPVVVDASGVATSRLVGVGADFSVTFEQ